jgi:hypothetical protein
LQAPGDRDRPRVTAIGDELTAQLEDPALYAGADGARRSAALGKELEGARRLLDDALSDWAAASESVERLASGA